MQAEGFEEVPEVPEFMFQLYAMAFEKIHNIDLSSPKYRGALVLPLDDTKPYDLSPANLLLCS